VRGVSLAGEGDRLAGALRAALQLADPLERYEALTLLQGEFDAMVSAVKVARGSALDEMLTDGVTQTELAEAAGLVRQKVQKLIGAARAAQREEQR
jgi:hypothetical protein